MPAPQGGGGQEADNSLAALWITLGIFVLLGFIWFFFKAYIIAFVLMIRGFEADFISLFVPSGWSSQLQQAQEFIQTARQGNYGGVTVNDLVTVSNQVGDYLRFPIAVILAGLAYLTYLSNAVSKFKKTYSMKSLLRAEQDNWPLIAPVLNVDLVHTDLNKGPWAMALSPMMFAKKHNLLIVEKIIPSEAMLASKAVLTARVNRDEARKVFAMQVGKFWTGLESLPIQARALFACFAARIAGDREGPSKLLPQIAASSVSGKLDFSGADELLNKHKNQKLVQQITSRHAFVLSVLASMLEVARQDGVFASADFLWLKPIDRPLWFMLNSVGRQTPFVEVAGPFNHWIAEKEIGRKLNVPMVEEAVTGLEIAIKELIYKPDEDEEQQAA